MSQLWVIAGPNGAGKTTLTESVMGKLDLKEPLPVINPDKIAAGR